MRIPQVRIELGLIATQLETEADRISERDLIAISHRIRFLISQLYRRSSGRRRKSTMKMTRKIEAKITNLAASSNMNQAEIAARVGVNPGRVSELLNGVRR